MKNDDVGDSNERKGFWKSKKNIAIVILSVLLFFSLGTNGNNITTENNITNEVTSEVTRLTEQIAYLQAKNEKLGKTLNEVNLEVANNEDYQNQISSLQSQVSELQEELNTVNEEKEKLSNELKNRSSQVEAEQSETSKTTVAESSISDSYTVYITNTGSKYHRSGCRYLKKSQNAISKDNAIAQGYTPCSVCNP